MRVSRKGLVLRGTYVSTLRKALSVLKLIEEHGVAGHKGLEEHAQQAQYPLKNLLKELEGEEKEKDEP